MEITLINGAKEYYCDVSGVQVKDGCLQFYFGQGYGRKQMVYPLTSVLKWTDPYFLRRASSLQCKGGL